MLRLTENDYRGGDIVAFQVSHFATQKLDGLIPCQVFFRGTQTHEITIAQMNNFQRDMMKSAISKFQITTYKGKSDHNMFTEGLTSGQHLDKVCTGFVLPTFDDLLRGLHHLPTGLDARGLTQCLTWYMHYRDAFTPKLEMNVLHTQALIRALRQPLRSFGPQNLDRNALREWQDSGRFDEAEVRFERQQPKDLAKHGEGAHTRSQLHMNLDDDRVTMDVKLPLRHAFTFPFLALFP